MRNYKKIVAWQRSHELTLAVYKVTKSFPMEERFGLTSQLRRAAYGTPSNIAEGSGRNTNRDYLRFLYIALASLKETEYFCLLSHQLEYLNDANYANLTDMLNGTFGTLQGLINAIDREVGVLGRFSATLLSAVFITLVRHSLLHGGTP